MASPPSSRFLVSSRRVAGNEFLHLLLFLTSVWADFAGRSKSCILFPMRTAEGALCSCPSLSSKTHSMPGAMHAQLHAKYLKIDQKKVDHKSQLFHLCGQKLNLEQNHKMLFMIWLINTCADSTQSDSLDSSTRPAPRERGVTP